MIIIRIRIIRIIIRIIIIIIIAPISILLFSSALKRKEKRLHKVYKVHEPTKKS